MKLVTGPRSKFLARLAERGVTFDAVRECVVEDSDPITVDVDHPKYPRPITAGQPSVPRPDSPGLRRWLQLYARSYLPVTDRAAELQRLERLADGMGCSCAPHWQTYLRDHPPMIDTPAEYEAWAVAARNAVQKRLGRTEWPVERVRADRLIIPDRLVVLSLDSRPDRWEAVTASIAKSDVLRGIPVERYRARPPSEMIVPDWWRWGDTIYATGKDHLNIIEQSYVAKHDNVLVLEDDAILQDCFDASYRAACKLLPDDWMGLWLTSDGHKKPPLPIARGLVRCTDQAMLHAYMLNRRGMHRVWHHLVTCHKQIIDGATEDLHGIEPHFYATELNAVRQFGDRFKGDRTDFFEYVGDVRNQHRVGHSGWVTSP